MGKIEIYSSKKKSVLILISSVIFVILCLLLAIGVFDADLVKRVVGAVGVAFFGIGVYISIKQLIKRTLMLVIDDTGINMNPTKSDKKVLWQNIEDFPIIDINGTKIILIKVNNPQYWIDEETNKFRKQLLTLNYNNYGTPFNISSGAMQIKHNELVELLNNSLAASIKRGQQ